MAASKRNAALLQILPKNWRLFTVAGLATAGMAAGVAQPTFADWWRLSSKPAAPAQQPGVPETGFAASIRRLQAESRAAAEKGDHAKAVKLAERAAKISEAAAQVLGPADCSPQETARFLADLKAQGTAPAIAAAKVHAPPTPKSAEVPAAKPAVAAEVGRPEGVMPALAERSTPPRSAPPLVGPTASPVVAATAPSAAVRSATASPVVPAPAAPAPTASTPAAPTAPAPAFASARGSATAASVRTAPAPAVATRGIPPLRTTTPQPGPAAVAARPATVRRDPTAPVASTRPAAPMAALPKTPAIAQAKPPQRPVPRPGAIRPTESAPVIASAPTSPGKNLFGAAGAAQLEPSSAPFSTTEPAEATGDSIAQAKFASVKPAAPSVDAADTSVATDAVPAYAEQVEDLLAQSRIAAADDDLDRAIELAEQARSLFPADSLFGAAASPSESEAERWHKALMRRRDTSPNEPTVRTFAATESLSAPVAEDRTIESSAAAADPFAEPGSSPSDAIDAPVATPAIATTESAQSEPAVEPPSPATVTSAATSSSPTSVIPTPTETATTDVWNEDLPPAPAPQLRFRRESPKYSRTVISRASGWIDAKEFDAAQREAAAERAAADAIPALPSTKTIPAEPPAASPSEPESRADVEPADEIPEFPLTSVSTPGFSADGSAVEDSIEPSRSIQLISADDSSDTTEEGRGPLKLRSRVQHAAAEDFLEPQDSSPVTAKPATRSAVRQPGAPQGGAAQPGFTKPDFTKAATARTEPARPPVAQPSAAPAEAPSKPRPSSDSPPPEVPVQRFPVQRVLQLREKLTDAQNSAAAEHGPGVREKNVRPSWSELEAAASEGDSPSARVIKAERTSGTAASAARATPVAAAPSNASSADTARRPLKLRGRPAAADAEPSSQSTSVPKSGVGRAPIVAQSEQSTWKSLDTAVAEPRGGSLSPPETGGLAVPPPVSQAAFEVPDAKLTTGSSAAAAESALPRIELPPDLTDAAPLPPIEPSTVPAPIEDTDAETAPAVSRSAFGIVDRLAEAYRLPISALVSLIGLGGFMMAVGGLIVMRSALKRRHD